jgi:hypothetical protein
METGELDHALDTAEELRSVLDDLEARSRSFGSALTDALKGAVLDGDSLTEVLQNIAMRFSSIALDVGLAPLQNSLTSVFSGLTSSLSNSLAVAGGGGMGIPAAAAPAIAGDGAGAPAILSPAAAAAGGSPTQVFFNVQAADAQSFRRSESQINAMLVRAVGRGRRSV